MKLFLQKIYFRAILIFERWGLRSQTPVPPADWGFAPNPPASSSWGLRSQTSIGLWWLGAPPPDPPNSPPLRVSGYAPAPAHEFLPFLDPIHSPNYAWSPTALVNLSPVLCPYAVNVWC